MPERDYTNDAEDWLINNPYEWQGPPQPPNMWAPGPVDPRTTVRTPTDDTPPPPKPPTAPTTGGRNPNAGPDGSNVPNMDPPGTRGGYWMNGQWVGGSPYQDTTLMNPYTAEGGMEVGSEGDFDPSTYPWTQFNPKPYDGYGEFQANPFIEPNPEATANDPWLQFALKQGTQQLENSAAYSGMVRSGMNKKNVIEHGVNFTRQFGNDVWNRAMQGWRANEDNRFRAWDGNRGNSLDTYNTNYRGQQDSFAGVRGSETMDFNARLQQWRDRLNATTQVATAGLS